MKDTSDSPQYRNNIETARAFNKKEIEVESTVDFDWVKLRKLLRPDAYPVHVKIEELPFKQKYIPENIKSYQLYYPQRRQRKKFSRKHSAVVTIF